MFLDQIYLKYRYVSHVKLKTQNLPGSEKVFNACTETRFFKMPYSGLRLLRKRSGMEPILGVSLQNMTLF